MGRGGLPPAAVSPAAPLRVGGWRAGKGRNLLRLARRRRWRDRRRACRAGRGAGMLPPAIVRPAAAIWRGGVPPASVWPAAALRVGGGVREASTCYCSAAGVGKTGRACSGRPCGGARCCRRRYGRRRFSVLGGAGGRGRRPFVSAPPPASARPAGRARGGHRAGRVAAGVGMAGVGSACWGGRAGEGGY